MPKAEQADITPHTNNSIDPVLAVIETHRIATVDWCAVSNEFFQVALKLPHGRRGPEQLPEGLVDHMIGAGEAERHAPLDHLCLPLMR